ncbi:hypothetical protein E2C01_042143 [Portunus trituberculatus]|uniref:Uncharacterized protein n=1 Tax=Portunus trituberculatus TaxID=210409 RepID=A0A5B7FTU3_PORTR|nr:hypothetical protein [Portunus trituberculatus]
MKNINNRCVNEKNIIRTPAKARPPTAAAATNPQHGEASTKESPTRRHAHAPASKALTRIVSCEAVDYIFFN